MGNHLPLVIVEGVMVFGGALLFGWWQLRSVRRDREKAARKAQLEAADAQRRSDAAPAPPQPRSTADPVQAVEPSDPTP